MASSFTPEQAERCREVFGKFDTNNDGVIDWSELKEGLKELGNFTDEHVAEIMNEADVDKNGVIDEAEFGKFAAEVFIKKVAKEEQIQDVFDKYDLDKDGLIGPDEIFCVTQDLGYEDISMPDAEMIVREFDTDSDGKLNFKELKSFLCK